MKKYLRKTLTGIAVLMTSLPVAATPYKNVWAQLDVATAGAGTVYMTSADPKPLEASVEGSRTELKATLTERDGGYPVELHAVASEGWTFYAFTNVLKANNDYTNEDIVSRDNPATVLISIPRETNTYVGVGASASEVEQHRDEARQNEAWPTIPDAHFYAVFVQEDGQLITTLTTYAPYQMPDGSGAMGRIIRPEIVHEGDEVTIEASPYPGFLFTGWTVHDELYSLESRIQVTAHADVTYMAHFSVAPLEIGDEGWVTYGSMKTVRVPSGEGLEAFVVSGIDGSKVLLRQVHTIPHETGVLFKAPSGSYQLDADTEAKDEPTEQSFLHAAANEPVLTDGHIYILANKEQGTGFYLLRDGEQVPPGKAYLRLDDDGKLKAQRFFSLAMESAGVENMMLSVGKDNVPSYNLAGQQVTSAFTGIVVKNGKKHRQR